MTRQTGFLQWTVPEAEHPSKWWLGFAWPKFVSRENVYYPIPLNWLARWIKSSWDFLRRARGGTTLEEQIHKVRQDAYNDGWNSGFQNGRRQGYREGREDLYEELLDEFSADD